jgi:hypothetical protein
MLRLVQLIFTKLLGIFFSSLFYTWENPDPERLNAFTEVTLLKVTQAIFKSASCWFACYTCYQDWAASPDICSSWGLNSEFKDGKTGLQALLKLFLVWFTSKPPRVQRQYEWWLQKVRGFHSPHRGCLKISASANLSIQSSKCSAGGWAVAVGWRPPHPLKSSPCLFSAAMAYHT